MVGVTKQSIDKAPKDSAAQHVPDHILAKLHPLEIKVLSHLKDGITIPELAQTAGMQEVEANRAVQWLEVKKALAIETATEKIILIDLNGEAAITKGLPESKFLEAVIAGATTTDEISKSQQLEQQEVAVSIGILKKAGAIDFKDNKITLLDHGKKLDFTHTIKLLQDIKSKSPAYNALSQENKTIIDGLKSRKQYITFKDQNTRTIKLTDLGHKLAKVDTKHLNFEEKLTTEDLQKGTWDKKYRAFDVTAPVPNMHAGKEHFVQEAIDYIKSIWLEMGFFEMEGNMVQSAFWDLDALFMPQDHPARETQDTFYLDNPKSTTIPKSIYERVRDTHENGGGTGSKGWRYKFSRAETEQLMLRTHTTVISAQTLLAIKEKKLPMPGKYFLVDKVFRNEALDWKHLFEFNHVEGIVVDPNVTFAQLIGYLKIFFAKMGFDQIRLRPHHFPYTEPSVEVDVWNAKKKQWVELGGAGVFRPEVTKTLLGEDIPVLAWGIGLERIIVEYFGLTDLRDLYKNDLKQLREMQRFIKIEK